MKTQDVTLFLREALKTLDNSNFMSSREWTDSEYYERGGNVYFKKGNRPNFEKLLNSFPPYIVYSTVANRFSSFLDRDEDFQEYIQNVDKKSFNSSWLSTRLTADMLFSEYLWQVNNLKYDEEIASEIAENFIQSITNRIFRVAFYSVLHGVELEVEEIEIAPGLKIKRLNLQDLSRLVKRNEKLHNDQVPQNRTIIEYTIDCEDGIIPINSTSTYRKNFEKVCSALRILKSGYVNFNQLYWYGVKPGQMGDRMFISSGQSFSISPRFNQYTLYKREVGDFQRLYKFLNIQQLKGNIQVAIDRINNSYIRTTPDDKLLDLIISLEALLGDNQPGGSTSKLAFRSAMLLGDSLEKRKKLKKVVIDAYSMRSKIVHGGNKKILDRYEILVDEILYILRSVIFLIMERYEKDSELISGDDFDTLIFMK